MEIITQKIKGKVTLYMKKIFKISVLLAVMTMLFGFTACSSPSAPAQVVIPTITIPADNAGKIISQYNHYKDFYYNNNQFNQQTGVAILFTDTGRCNEQDGFDILSKGTYTVSTGNIDDICKEDFTGTVTFTITQVNPPLDEHRKSAFTVGTHTVEINNGEFTINGFTCKHKDKR